MTFINPISCICSKAIPFMSCSLPLTIAIILLPSNLANVYASNNLDNIKQKLEFADTVNLTNNERDSVYGQISSNHSKSEVHSAEDLEAKITLLRSA